jgi:N-terminal 7TM region of histidine kinase/Bacterial regulatory protein, Fis family
MDFTPYALPAMVALLAKIGIFYYARYTKVHNIQTQLYLLCLFALSIQDLTEIQLFLSNAKALTHPPEISGTIYYSASILAIAFFLHLTLALAKIRTHRGGVLSVGSTILLYAPAVGLHALLLAPPLLIAGYEPMGYTYIRVPGPYYFLYQVYAIGYLAAAAGILFYGSRRQTTPLRRLQNKYLLIGLVPTAIVVPVVIVLQQVGVRGINSTVTVPLTVSFFLVVTAYAIHQHRLFDITFFLPWSKVRRRKTAFYRRIQALITEIAEMGSVQRIIQSVSDALHCPIAMIGGPKPALAMAGEAFGIARFPLDELKRIDHIVVANEIAATMPTTYALMKRHKVAAVVPFHPYSQAAASWMLLGEAFNEQVYSPLDFKTVETLFARLADRFLDNQLLLRSQLLEAQREIDALHMRLADTWEQIDALRKKLDGEESEAHPTRRKELDALHGELTSVQLEAIERLSEKRSLDEHVADFEARLIAKTVEHCNGDIYRAAELLDLPLETLQGKLRQIANAGIDPAGPEVLFV